VVPRGIELTEERLAPLLLIDLADRRRGTGETGEGPQEAPVLLVGPPHVARAAPPVLAQPVEPSVVAHAEARVRLDVVASQLAEVRPGVEESRPSRDHTRHHVAPCAGRRGQRVLKCRERVRRLEVEHGRGRP